MKKIVLSLFTAGFIGVAVAATYHVFSNIVEELQNILWFDIANTDDNKLFIIPTAVIGGLVLAIVLQIFKTRGHQEIGHVIGSYAANAKELNTKWVVVAFIIGLTSLVAGASLGPEAVLLPISYALGYLVAKALRIDKPEQFGMLGIIALLAAFFNAYAAALLPLIFITYNKTKELKQIITVLLLGFTATFFSIGLLRLLQEREGYIYIGPVGEITVTPQLFVVAIVLSAVATLVPFLLDAITKPLTSLFSLINKHWLIGGLVAGLGVGIVYYLIGPIGFFSGHIGLGELLRENSEYTSLQLIGLAVGKLVVTAWCVATIYRGGVIFPQLLVGMSIALLLSGAVPDSSWLATLLIGAFFGIFTGALGSIIIAAAFIFSLFGLTAWPLVLAAAIGAFIVKTIFKKRFAASAL